MARSKNLESLGRQVLLCLKSGEEVTAEKLVPLLKIPKRNISFELSRLSNNTFLCRMMKKWEDSDKVYHYQMIKGLDLSLEDLAELCILSFEKYHSGEYSPQLQGTYFKLKQPRKKNNAIQAI